MPELIETVNQVAGGPNGITVTGQQPEYFPNRQNGKHGWVFSSGNHHIKLAAPSPDFDVNGCQISLCGKKDTIPADNDFPRGWAIGDVLYLAILPDGRVEIYRRYSISDARYQSVNPIVAILSPFILDTIIDASAPSSPPTLRRNGANVQLQQLSVGRGSPISTAGMEFHIGNRAANDNGTTFLDRGFSGDIYDFAAIDRIPTLIDQKTALDEMAASWGVGVANPFAPSIEDQGFNIQATATAGATVGTVQAQNVGTSPSYGLTGIAALLFDIGAATGTLTLKNGVELPEIGSSVTGTISVDNGVETDTAVVTITTIANSVSALRFPRSLAPWLNTVQRVETPTSGGGTLTYRPNYDGEDILIIGPDTECQRGAFVIDRSGSNHFGNIGMIKGKYRATDDAGSGRDAVWRIHSMRGTFWGEGLRLEGGNRQDGFQIATRGSSLKSDWYFQRMWWDNVTGERPSPHGDTIQPLGPCRHIYVSEFWGESEYQGFFFDDDNGSGAKVDGVTMGDGNLYHFNDRNTGGFLIWLDTTYTRNTLIGHATDRNINPVWCTRHQFSTPPNRLFAPREIASYDADNGLLTINHTASNGSTVRGLINVGQQPGGDYLAEGPKPGLNFIKRGTTDILGGVDYPAAA